MRKIETAIINAINEKRTCNLSQRDRVEYTSDASVNFDKSEVFLHGHRIATVYHTDKRVTVWDCGWQTVTTKSRLNAILTTYVGKRIFQRDYVWYVADYTTRNEPTVDFESGTTYAITEPLWTGNEWQVSH
jgi:hypothetical protein